MITVERALLSTAMTLAREACPKKEVQQITGMVRLAPGPDVLVIEATDTELTLVQHCKAQVGDDHAPRLVPAETLLNCLKSVSDNELNLDWGDKTIRLLGARTRYTLPCRPTDGFPSRQQQPVQGSLVLTVQQLDYLLGAVSYCTSEQSGRQSLFAIQFDLVPGRITLCATDSRHLAILRQDCPESQVTARFLLAPRAVSFLRKILRTLDDSSSVTMQLHKTGVSFETANLVFSTQLVEGTPVPYTKLLTLKMEQSCRLASADFREALKQVAAVTGAIEVRTTLTFEPGKLVLESTGVASSHSELPLAYQGEVVQMNINPQLPLIMFAQMAFTEDLVCSFQKNGYLSLSATPAAGVEFLYLISPLVLAATPTAPAAGAPVPAAS